VKKILFLIVVGALVAPLVIAGSGLTSIFSHASVSEGYLEYSQTDYYMGEDGDWPASAMTNMTVINLGDSNVRSLVQAEKDDTTVKVAPCTWCDIPNVQKWTYVDVSPLVCPDGGGNGGGNGGCNDPYKSESIAWGPDGEAYMYTDTLTEGGYEETELSIYGKGGTGYGEIVVSSLDEGFVEWGYTALGDFCEDVDQCPSLIWPEPPEEPERPDCENGFCP